MFKASFADYELLPQNLIAPAALVLVLAEAAIVVGLVMPLTRPAAAIAAVVLLVLYGGAIAVNLRRGRYLHRLRLRRRGAGSSPGSWSPRNAILAAIAVLAAAAPVGARRSPALDALVLASRCVTVWLLILASRADRAPTTRIASSSATAANKG